MTHVSLLFLLFPFLVWSQAPSDRLEIKVLSLNVRYDNERDGPDKWLNRRETMKDFLLAEKPDFLGVQEALANQVDFLAEALRGYGHIGVGRDDGERGGEFMTLYYDASRWSLVYGTTFWLSEAPDAPTMGWDAACYRVCTYGIFANGAGDTIVVNNTHLDHIGKEARRNSVIQLADHFDHYNRVYPALLMGDFNFEPTDPLYDDMSARMTDIYTIAEEVIYTQAGTFNGFKLDKEPLQRIDYIWLDADKWDVQRYEHRVVLTSQGRHMSDHFPVIGRLKLKRKW